MPDHCATTEEMNLQMQVAEERMEKRLQESHLAIAGTISNFGSELQALNKKLDSVDFEALSKMTDFFKGVVGFRSFIVGLASVVIAISAIGAGVIFIIKSVKG